MIKIVTKIIDQNDSFDDDGGDDVADVYYDDDDDNANIIVNGTKG